MYGRSSTNTLAVKLNFNLCKTWGKLSFNKVTNTYTDIWYANISYSLSMYPAPSGVTFLSTYPVSPTGIYTIVKGPLLYTQPTLTNNATSLTIKWMTSPAPPNAYWPTNTTIKIVISLTCQNTNNFTFVPTSAQYLTITLTAGNDLPLPGKFRFLFRF